MAPGERSEEVYLWYTAVYEAIQEIPRGRVTSYGHIARLLGKREHPDDDSAAAANVTPHHSGAAQAGRSLSQTLAIAIVRSQQAEADVSQWERALAARDQRQRWHQPQHVNNQQRGPSAASHQADALRREGVEIREDAMGLYTIDLSKYGWFPDVLPSETSLVESSEEEQEDEDAAAYHT